MACDAVVAVVDSFHVRLTVGAVGDEPVVVHGGFDSVANGDVALLVADDGMEVADGSLDRPVGSLKAVAQSSYRDCCAAVYPDDTGDDRIAGNGAAVETSFHRRIGSVDAAGVVATVVVAAAGVVDSELDQALASVSSALPVVVPCFVAAVDIAAGGADGVCRCRRRGHLRPFVGHCWGHPCRWPVVRRAVMVRSPVGERLAAESESVPSH